LLLPFELKSLLELGGVHKVLRPPSGQLRGDEVLQVEEVCRRAADIQRPRVLPTPFELKTRDAFQYIDSVRISWTTLSPPEGQARQKKPK